jgi:peptidoglycan hydrolase-like protein with peptidoglycan-binding domain
MLRTIAALILVLVAQPANAESAFTSKDVVAVQTGLAADDYDVGDIDGRFGERMAAAIRQYQSDWQLPVDGKISRELVRRVERSHPATKPQWKKIGNKDCQVWNPFPSPREEIFWDGGCVDGKASGTGRMVMRFIEQGRPRENSYEGEVRAGKLHGRGTLTASNGDRYEGEFRDGEPTGNGRVTRAEGA